MRLSPFKIKDGWAIVHFASFVFSYTHLDIAELLVMTVKADPNLRNQVVRDACS